MSEKGTWEAVFGHLGTPDEVGNEWIALQHKVDAWESKAEALGWNKDGSADAVEFLMDHSFKRGLMCNQAPVRGLLGPAGAWNVKIVDRLER